MKRQLATLLALTASAAGNALADDITIDSTRFASSRSRTEVQAELASYKQSRVNPWSIAYDPLRNFVSSTTRAEVRASYITHRQQVADFTGEDSGAFHLSRNGGAVSDGKMVGASPARVMRK